MARVYKSRAHAGLQSQDCLAPDDFAEHVRLVGGCVQVTDEELKSLNLRELGEYYEVPAFIMWKGNPMKSCTCLRSTLTDMVMYAPVSYTHLTLPTILLV